MVLIFAFTAFRFQTAPQTLHVHHIRTKKLATETVHAFVMRWHSAQLNPFPESWLKWKERERCDAIFCYMCFLFQTFLSAHLKTQATQTHLALAHESSSYQSQRDHAENFFLLLFSNSPFRSIFLMARKHFILFTRQDVLHSEISRIAQNIFMKYISKKYIWVTQYEEHCVKDVQMLTQNDQFAP